MISGDVFNCKDEIYKIISSLHTDISPKVDIYTLDIQNSLVDLINFIGHLVKGDCILVLNNYGLEFMGEDQYKAIKRILDFIIHFNAKVFLITSSSVILKSIYYIGLKSNIYNYTLNSDYYIIRKSEHLNVIITKSNYIDSFDNLNCFISTIPYVK